MVKQHPAVLPEDRMRLMQAVKNQSSTHVCPRCKEPAYCAMEDGFSANLCWCMTLPAIGEIAEGECLCKTCLMKSVNKDSATDLDKFK